MPTREEQRRRDLLVLAALGRELGDALLRVGQPVVRRDRRPLTRLSSAPPCPATHARRSSRAGPWPARASPALRGSVARAGEPRPARPTPDPAPADIPALLLRACSNADTALSLSPTASRSRPRWRPAGACAAVRARRNLVELGDAVPLRAIPSLAESDENLDRLGPRRGRTDEASSRPSSRSGSPSSRRRALSRVADHEVDLAQRSLGERPVRRRRRHRGPACSRSEPRTARHPGVLRRGADREPKLRARSSSCGSPICCERCSVAT